MDKTILITGCTSGIGHETALDLAKSSNNLILVSRDQTKLLSLEDELKNLNHDILIKTYKCDFENLQEVVDVSKKIAIEQKELDVLINNAAIWEEKQRYNSDGFEVTWAVNYYAPFLFTHYLIHVLEKRATETGDARIIIVGSEAHRQGSIDFQNLYEYSFRKSYASTKLANMLHTFKLARENKTKGLTINTLHPGVVATGLWRKLPSFVVWILNLVLISPEKGAQTTLFLAKETKPTGTGLYFSDCKIKAPSELASNVELQDKLYEFTIETLKKYL